MSEYYTCKTCSKYLKEDYIIKKTSKSAHNKSIKHNKNLEKMNKDENEQIDKSINEITNGIENCNLDSNEEIKKVIDNIIDNIYIDNNTIYFSTTNKNSNNYNDLTEHTWDFNNQIKLTDFLEETFYNFKYAGYVTDNDKDDNDKDDKDDIDKVGYKIVELDEFKNKEQIIYLMTITFNNIEYIIKGGKVKGNLSSRSYYAGTQTQWTNNNISDPSPTNYIYSQIFRSCIKKKIPVNFWVHESKLYKITDIGSDGTHFTINISNYEELEKKLNSHLKKKLGRKIIGEGDLQNTFKS